MRSLRNVTGDSDTSHSPWPVHSLAVQQEVTRVPELMLFNYVHYVRLSHSWRCLNQLAVQSEVTRSCNYIRQRMS